MMGRKESNQTKQRSGPTDLDPNRLTLIVFLKDFFEKLEKKVNRRQYMHQIKAP